MFCAQDPLRKEGQPGVVTIGTFFGTDNERYRHYINPGDKIKPHHPAMWDVVRTCLDADYDVWLTDAVKVFAGPENLLLKDKRGRQLCSDILVDEIAQVQPVRIVALGGAAANELHRVAVKEEVIEGGPRHGIATSSILQDEMVSRRRDARLLSRSGRTARGKARFLLPRSRPLI
ncbi:MAG: hypothetical protein JXR35_01570 [Rhodobacteraceae bacterium]|nr:hypothetical protein [Paracoccaceae bacterium]